QARQGTHVRAQPFEKYLRADQRLDAGAARGLVELDGAEQVAQVGDGQRGLAIVGGGLDNFIDAVGAVDDGEFGMQAKVNEHSLHCRKPPPRGDGSNQTTKRFSGSGMNSVSPGTWPTACASQSCAACAMRSLRLETKFHQMKRRSGSTSPPSTIRRAAAGAASSTLTPGE